MIMSRHNDERLAQLVIDDPTRDHLGGHEELLFAMHRTPHLAHRAAADGLEQLECGEPHL
jgi:hypothetical protein